MLNSFNPQMMYSFSLKLEHWLTDQHLESITHNVTKITDKDNTLIINVMFDDASLVMSEYIQFSNDLKQYRVKVEMSNSLGKITGYFLYSGIELDGSPLDELVWDYAQSELLQKDIKLKYSIKEFIKVK